MDARNDRLAPQRPCARRDPPPPPRAARSPALAALSLLLALAAASGHVGCSYGFGEHVVTQPLAEGNAKPLDQAGRGEEVFAESCAGCHGEAGEGIEGRPAIAGEKALPLDPPPGAKARTTQLRTAADVFAFIKSDMPPIAPGSLPDDQTWAVVAFLLKSKKIQAGKGDINEANAASIEINR
jgi:cytochrome c